jgi:hypothetical protein
MASGSGSNSLAESDKDPVQAAVVAAEQLNSLWRKGVYSKLLRRPPPASWEGTAADAANSTKGLLAALDEGLAAARSTANRQQQVLEGLKQHNFSHLMAQLAVWLQQRPEVTLEQAACSSSSSNSSSRTDDIGSSVSHQGTCHVTSLWTACMTSLGNMAGMLSNYTHQQPFTATPHAEHLASSLESAGGKHGLRCIIYSDGQHSSSVRSIILSGAQIRRSVPRTGPNVGKHAVVHRSPTVCSSPPRSICVNAAGLFDSW